MLLAGIGGTFVVGTLTDDGPEPPTTSFDLAFSGSGPYTVTVTHESGDAIGGNLRIIYNDGSEATWTGSASDPISLGETRTVSGISAGTTVRVVWVAQSGATSETLAVAEAPSS